MGSPCWSQVVTAATEVVNSYLHPDYLPRRDRGLYPINAQDVALMLGTFRKITPVADARIVSQVIMLDHVRRHDGERHSELDVARMCLCSQQAVNLNWRKFHEHGTERIRTVYCRTVDRLLQQGFTLRGLSHDQLHRRCA